MKMYEILRMMKPIIYFNDKKTKEKEWKKNRFHSIYSSIYFSINFLLSNNNKTRRSTTNRLFYNQFINRGYNNFIHYLLFEKIKGEIMKGNIILYALIGVILALILLSLAQKFGFI